MVEGTGLENRQAGNRLVGSNPTPSATCCIETVLRLRQVPDFLLVFKGYNRKAIHLRQRQNAENRSLKADIL